MLKKLFIFLITVILAALLLSGCSSRAFHGFPQGVSQDYVWPPPPEKSRVAWVMDIREHKDLFDEGGFWASFKEMVGGERDSSILRPYSVALHPEGGLLVGDPGRKGVHFFDWNRRRYVLLGQRMDGGLPSPIGMSVLPDGSILVSDSRLESIEIFNEKGKHKGSFCNNDFLVRPAGIAVSKDRKEVYVVDVVEHQIKVFDLNGNLLRKMGRQGTGEGELNFPTHLTLDTEGNLVVMDTMNFRVQTLSPEGKFIGMFGRLGDAPGQFSKPKGVAVDKFGNIVAVEGLYDSLLFFDPQGQFLLHIGGPGSEPGKFWLPGGVCIDSRKGLIFVADGFNNRVQVFRIFYRDNSEEEIN